MHKGLSPVQWYQQALAQGFVADAAQQQAVEALEACHRALCAGQQPVTGIYLWGPVGRGKTWLMDHFHAGLPVPSRRQHFHHFMRDLHRQLHQRVGTSEPLQAIAQALASDIRVLCFDEFFVSDIADAMLLGPLLQALFARGLTVVMTSNQPPDGLYPDGFNRERLLPAIAAIHAHMQVVSVDGSQDHRLHGVGELTQLPRYHVRQPGGPEALAGCFAGLTAGMPAASGDIRLGSRMLATRGHSGGVLWCDFAELCEAPFAAADYIELCQQFQVVLLGRVPVLGGVQQPAKIARGTEDAATRVVAGDRILPALALQDDAVRRFIALIDECYEGKVCVHIEAGVPLDELYTQGYLSFAFRRTRSRLLAMQSDRFNQAACIAIEIEE
ncbi:MAG: cell division protein ZapE [Gammaproteobacteria bacterium]|nr:cell division protein ZapE [Gammaproteobacteria bacterium]